MALADIYQLTLTQRYGTVGEELNMVFFYNKNGSGETAADLAEAFKQSGGVLDAINLIQSSAVNNVRTRTINLGDLGDFDESAATGVGGQGPDCLPEHSAFGMTLKLDTRAIHPGSKRIPGVSESVQTQGLITDATEITNLNVLAALLAADIEGADTAIYRPIVVKRVPRHDDGPPVRDWYSLPETDGEVVTGHVVFVLVNLKVSHQVSRGNGR